MKYTFYIAKRYLLAKKEAGFITVISLISILGVTVGVAALIVVLSVFNGFNGLVTDILVGFDPHVRIQFPASADTTVIRAVGEYLDSLNEVVGQSAFVSGKGMMISRKTTKVIFIRGLETQALPSVSGVTQSMIIGNAAFSENTSEIVIGYSLADKLGIGIDDTLFIVTSAGVQNALTGMALPQLFPLRVIGIYEAKNKEYDGMYAFTTLETAQQLFASGTVHGYDIRLISIDVSESFVLEIKQKFGESIIVQSWFDLHKDLYSVMQVERWSAFIILALIIAVASFNLLGSLTMTVIEKTRDIGILKAMGATQSDIMTIFRLEGILVGIIGSLLGLGLGALICWMQVEFQLFALDSNVYIIPAIPIEMRLMDMILVPLSALLLCSLAAYYPSKRAALLQPSDAVRWE
ncbi:MAG: ABC transporter permease [Bacteriovoracaceae bacterium]|nr:ABC transporter permease [Bacteroidota bacterium]